jgi:uncharacterized protein
MIRVLVTGGTGFVGKALIRALLERGDQVTVLSRDARGAANELPRDVRSVAWTPGKAGPWQSELGVVDAVVHLAGSPVATRWNDKVMATIEKSRVDATRALVEAIAKADKKPRVLVSASGTNFYGHDRGDEELDEDASAGKGFLAKVCVGWEGEAKKADDLGVRTVQLRIGLVLGSGGGALSEMVRFGVVGGPVGKGDNKLSWIHLDDVVGLILLALDNPEVKGPINATSPYVTTQKELAKTIGSVTGNPAVPVPEVVARLMLGGAVDVMIGSLHVHPRRAIDLGYEYHHARLVPALEAALMSD